MLAKAACLSIKMEPGTPLSPASLAPTVDPYRPQMVCPLKIPCGSETGLPANEDTPAYQNPTLACTKNVRGAPTYMPELLSLERVKYCLSKMFFTPAPTFRFETAGPKS
ncbi:hypothetical protein PS874_00500 [Pseudomonas fluorescens]|nr:hypothetical protein PS874_00500 [Pseudomonas fluorescens]